MNNSVENPQVESPEKSPRAKFTAVVIAKYIAVSLSVLMNVVLVGYYGFYGHRTKINDAIIAQYNVVQERQKEVFDFLIKTIPSKRNGDRNPSAEEIDQALNKLDDLQQALSVMITNSAPLDAASEGYKDAIGEMAHSLIILDYSNPVTLTMAQNQFYRWDVSAKYFKEAFDERTTSFWRTIGGVL